MILIIKLIKESAIFAFTSIMVNKLRTILTLLGINVSVIIGLISGFMPAYSASRMDPVVAIRTNR